MNTPIVSIKCAIATSDAAAKLGMRITLNGQVLQDIAHVSEPVQFACEVSDSEAEHTLCFEMYGKTEVHTQLDDNGSIVKDAYLSISDVIIDDLALPDMNSWVYDHDHNGAGPAISDKFFGYVGCNGTVTLKFTTPIYLWLLENM